MADPLEEQRGPVASPVLPGRTRLLLHPGHRWTDDAGETWTLEDALPIEVIARPEGVEAVASGEMCDAFGSGESTDEALRELLALLSDTLQSLEEREERLGESALRELELLRRLVRHQN